MRRFPESSYASMLVSLCACLLLIQCDQPSKVTQVPVNSEPIPAKYEALKTSIRKKGTPLGIDHLDELLEPVAWIPLENSEQAFISRVWEAALIGERIFLLDFDLQLINCYDRQGRFITQIGRRGQGPGEFQQADGMVSWQGQLVVSDSQRGKLLFYSPSGDFLREVDTWRSGRGVGLSKFFLLQGSRLYVCNQPVQRPDEPNHVILDITDKPTVLYGFGKSFPHFWDSKGTWRPGFDDHLFAGMIGVDETVWVAPPFKLGLEIFTREGQFLGETLIGENGLTYHDFADMKRPADFARIRRSKARNTEVWHLSPYVVLLYSRPLGGSNQFLANVYLESGELVASAVAVNRLLSGVFAKDSAGVLIAPIQEADLSPGMLDELLVPEVIALREEQGNQKLNDNLTLVLSVPRQ